MVKDQFKRAAPLKKTAILLVNLGSPSAPEKKEVKEFLLEFLSDRRVIMRQGLLWQMILRGVILNIRPKKSLKAYKKIWLDEGSPLSVYTKSLTEKLADQLTDKHISISYAMRYGEPSIQNTLSKAMQKGCERLIVLPLYPQYSVTTTASVFDAVYDFFKKASYIPELCMISDYHDKACYIDAICQSILDFQQHKGRADKLIFSYHGLPQSYIEKGDLYYDQCCRTTQKIAQRLQLQESEYIMCFQSRFGVEKWLMPYTLETLQSLPEKAVKSVQVICPGFAVDCLETLEEIAIENKNAFLAAGGASFEYIDCLNNTPAHIEVMSEILSAYV